MYYLFNNTNQNEYIGTHDGDFMPDCMTTVAPPEYAELTVPCWNVETQTWDKTIPDWRNKTAYRKSNSLSKKFITLVGDYSDDFVLTAPPDTTKEYHWNSETGAWVEYVRPVTAQDYDDALEAHLDEELRERGYTKRSPIEYSGSTNTRWAQDAKDWNTHLTAVMEYGLSVINDYEAGLPVPTLDEFKAALPKITWTLELA